MVHFVEVSLLYSLIEEFLGWVPARCLRQSHRRARTVEATRRLRQELQRLEGIRGPGTHPLDYTTLTRRQLAQTIGFLRQFRTPTGALARLPSALGWAPVQDIMVRYVGPWHQTRSRAIIPEELQGIFPHGGFDRALRWLRTRGERFGYTEDTACHRASRVHYILTEVFAVECVLCGLEVSLRMTYRTVLPSDEA